MNAKPEKRVICFVISTLACGGAQRNIAIMADYWAERGHEVLVVSLDPDRGAAFFPFHPSVRLVTLNAVLRSEALWRAVGNNIHRVARLREILREHRPDVVISFLTTSNILTLLAGFGVADRIIVSERIATRNPTIGAEWFALRWALYHLASCIVVQSARTTRSLPRLLSYKCAEIPNPVPEPSPRRIPGNAAKRIIGVGRLDHQKGFDLLIEAFAMIAPSRPGWSLAIFGTGPLRDDLLDLAADLNVDGKVQILPTSHAIFEEMARSSMFVLSSRYEGFPNALCEAMAIGLPSVSFDCPGASSEIIHDGVNGLVVPNEDVPALARAIERLIANPSEAERMGAAAREVTRQYSIERVMAMWERVAG